MKVVKVCPECKKYNSYKAYECAFCGANLNDDTIEVEDNETQLKQVVKEEILKDNEDINESKESKLVKVCPLCGCKTSEDWCPECGMYLEGIESIDSSDDLKKEINSLEFSLDFNGNKFTFNALNSINTLGRHDFDSLNNSDFISVSRNHLEYYLKDNNLIFKDISSYGTYLNGIKMEPNKEYIISNKDKVKLVYFEMEINF